ncbi:MAG: hypothetical protein P5680_14100 [Limnospira sp. PMC 737.11]|uniref:Uncharacterized protein n=1 Tax=Limnospira fusiformis PMC 851.14 TaxID=2219512 RepID=A0ABU9EPT9_LIMFS|nr:hypothetical protein [Limnospira sp. PMC 737.11]MDT9275725.1 hypothetical protein [Limnospira sp. PMC 737.11]
MSNPTNSPSGDGNGTPHVLAFPLILRVIRPTLPIPRQGTETERLCGIYLPQAFLPCPTLPIPRQGTET